MSRLNIAEVAPEMYKTFIQAEQVISKGPLDPAIRELVKIRSSQINGCLFCIDMHVHEALRLGEKQDRIYQLSAWRESELYTDAERVALAYAEAVTERPDGVSDEVWGAVAAAFKPEEAAYLVAQVAQINLWNRIASPMHTRPPKRG
ncbi:carboxymuconolactone decarboxylase family protein [Streptosporangium sp. NBC_01755]|uniref:carboxymuconolactone decarboxylase family protein n=1 Tax=unclassified Streptosporangium TaxID=2632669 RepID=UPI002DD92847|nr:MULTISPECIES: carboxymuconolactone decarboxylase family protein [unclassified Streptosporangium]WSA29387.1 carboxymuconolactone decarboxylase family protein [Streptosporangium sp. NBC_01810]WSC99169.1 carboxymuconolactone decarboxylase family protein [Streptosporangium sp. NBC_01755]